MAGRAAIVLFRGKVTEMSSVDTRNIARDSLFLFADVAIEGRADTLKVKVRNLSAGGMMAECGAAVTRGERLTVILRNVGEVRGSIAWIQGNRFGIAFDNQVDPKLVRAPAVVGETEAPRFARPASVPGGFSAEERRIRSL